MPDEYTTGDLAKALGVSRPAVAHVIKSRSIKPGKKIGAAWVYDSEAFNQIRSELSLIESIKRVERARRAGRYVDLFSADDMAEQINVPVCRVEFALRADGVTPFGMHGDTPLYEGVILFAVKAEIGEVRATPERLDAERKALDLADDGEFLRACAKMPSEPRTDQDAASDGIKAPTAADWTNNI